MTGQEGSPERRAPVSSESLNIAEAVTRIDTPVALIGAAGAAFGIFFAQRPGISGWSIGLTYLATISCGFAIVSVLIGLLFSIPSRRFYLDVDATENARKRQLYQLKIQAYAGFTRFSLALLLLAALMLIPAVVLYTPSEKPWPSYQITQTMDNGTGAAAAQTNVHISISFPDLTPGDAIAITVSHEGHALGFALGGAGHDGTGMASLFVPGIPESEQVTMSVTAPGWTCHGQLKLGNSQFSCGWMRL